MKNYTKRWLVLPVCITAIAGGTFLLLGSLDAQLFLMTLYAHEGGGSWNVARAIQYLNSAPRMGKMVEVQLSQGAQIERIPMVEALFLCLQTDVGMSKAEWKMLSEWAENRDWPSDSASQTRQY
jgi:hypothetical protein